MRDLIEIENIEERRREAGIDDAELREQIRRLVVGDRVTLTLLSGRPLFADRPLLIQITRIRGATLRGKVVGKPSSAGPRRLRPGTLVAFTTAHIHSVPAAQALAPSPGPPSNSHRGRGPSMAAKPTTPSRPPPRAELPAEPPLTTEERLQRIAAMGQRVTEYVEFMGRVGSLNGTSAEAKERAVVAFYERLAVLEGQLARIHEDLRLG